MTYLVLSLALVILHLTSNVYGFSCTPCNEVTCTQPVCDYSGTTLDACGCCSVCAKAFNETCVGLSNVEESCDKNLTCVGKCSDKSCRAIVDFVFALDGSQSSRFGNLVFWADEVITRIYDMYGACANVEVVQYAGIGGDNAQVYAVNFGACTNNINCISRKFNGFSHLNLPGKETFATLLNITAERFPMSSRYDRSHKVIVVLSSGDTADASLSERWLMTSSSNKIVTYAVELGAKLEELVNITGSQDRVIQPISIDVFLSQIWENTVHDRCASGEEYFSCLQLCQPTCADRNPLCSGNCIGSGCACKKGYARHNGTCIPEENCDTADECLLGEVYKECSSACEPTCAAPDPNCIKVCMPGKCQCEDGYVRENGKCILFSECPRAGNCSSDEVFLNCSTTCQPTCDNPNPTCTRDCGPPRCQCKSGYVMHNGTCIQYQYCPSPKTCMQQCPDIQHDATATVASAAWVCNFKNWRCTSYQWKLSIEEWWYSSGCYMVGGEVEAKWKRLFKCPEQVEITCKHPSQHVYDVDAFGCEMGRCNNGSYKDGRQLMKLWLAHQMKYQEKLQLYNEATTMCQRNFNAP